MYRDNLVFFALLFVILLFSAQMVLRGCGRNYSVCSDLHALWSTGMTRNASMNGWEVWDQVLVRNG